MYYEVKISEVMGSERVVGFGEGRTGDALRLFAFECDRAADEGLEGVWVRLYIDGLAKIGWYVATGVFVQYAQTPQMS